MYRKIRYDREFWKTFSILGELNKASATRIIPSAGEATATVEMMC
jgi:hypothetical protein